MKLSVNLYILIFQEAKLLCIEIETCKCSCGKGSIEKSDVGSKRDGMAHSHMCPKSDDTVI